MTDKLLQMRDQLGQRRTYEVLHDQIGGKLSSKRDWYDFLQ